MSKQSTASKPVSANNPCPFLRALVSDGQLADGVVPLGTVAATVKAAAALGDGAPVLPAPVIYAIASIANGLGPSAFVATQRKGLRLNELRAGPLNKRGVGSGILDERGEVDVTQLARIAEFASQKTLPDAKTELGLDLAELGKFMDANFNRAESRARSLDRKLMDGEWPVLLKVMGKDSPTGRYLSVADVKTLFTQARLPKRMTDRAAAS